MNDDDIIPIAREKTPERSPVGADDLLNQEAFQFAAQRDKGRTSQDCSFQTKGFNDVETASSDFTDNGDMLDPANYQNLGNRVTEEDKNAMQRSSSIVELTDDMIGPKTLKGSPDGPREMREERDVNPNEDAPRPVGASYTCECQPSPSQKMVDGLLICNKCGGKFTCNEAPMPNTEGDDDDDIPDDIDLGHHSDMEINALHWTMQGLHADLHDDATRKDKLLQPHDSDIIAFLADGNKEQEAFYRSMVEAADAPKEINTLQAPADPSKERSGQQEQFWTVFNLKSVVFTAVLFAFYYYVIYVVLALVFIVILVLAFCRDDNCRGQLIKSAIKALINTWQGLTRFRQQCMIAYEEGDIKVLLDVSEEALENAGSLLKDLGSAGMINTVVIAEEDADTVKNQARRKYIHEHFKLNKRPRRHKDRAINIRYINSISIPKGMVGGRNTVHRYTTEVPMWGIRPCINLMVSSPGGKELNCKMLFDTGAQCCSFDREFLNKLERETNCEIKVCGDTTITGFGGNDQKLDKSQLILRCPDSEPRALVNAVINQQGSPGHQGIVGTPVMAHFQMSIHFLNRMHDGVIITHKPKLGQKGKTPMKVWVDDDDDQANINELTSAVRQSTKHESDVVIMKEDCLNVAGTEAHGLGMVMNMSKKVRRRPSPLSGMIFVPDPGYEQIMMPGIHMAASKLIQIKMRNRGDLDVHLPAGTVVGRVKPENYDPRKQILHMNRLKAEYHLFRDLGGARGRELDCVCTFLDHHYRNRYTIVYLGDGYGFNYSNQKQFLEPTEPLASTDVGPAFRVRGNIITIKRHREDEAYDIRNITNDEGTKLKEFLKGEVVVILPYRDEPSRGVLEAVFEISKLSKRGTTQRTRVVRHMNENCKRCSTLACQSIGRAKNTLIRGFGQVEIMYSMDGTTPEPKSANIQKVDFVDEAQFIVKGSARLQVYRAAGALKIMVHVANKDHLYSNSNEQKHHLVNIHAYLFNQLRILKVPRKLNILASWGSQDPRNQMLVAMKHFELWEPVTGTYSPITPDQGAYQRIRKYYAKCSCKTCQSRREEPQLEKDRERKFTWLFEGDPTYLNKGALVSIDLGEDFDALEHEVKQLSRAWMNVISRKQHRRLVESAIIKDLENFDGGHIWTKGEGPHAINVLHAQGLEDKCRTKRYINKIEARWAKKLPEDDDQTIYPEPKRLEPPSEEFIQAVKDVEVDQESDTETDVEVQDALKHYAGEFDLDTLIASRHRTDDNWRDFYHPDIDPKFRFPKNPKARAYFEKIMDRHNDGFSKRKNAWRLMKIDPIHIAFDPDADPIIHAHRKMNPVDDYVLTKKVDELVKNDLIQLIEPDQSRFMNITRLFLVKHNSNAGAHMKMNDIRKDQFEDLDTSLWRIVADYRLVNASILNKNYAKYIMGTPQEVVAEMGAFNCFICLDLKAAYRSIPCDAATRDRLTLRADTKMYRTTLLQMPSIVDGIAVAPQIITEILGKALGPLKKHVVNWIDDITIHAHSTMEALEILEKVLVALDKIKALVALDKMQLTVDFDPETGDGDGQSFTHMGFNVNLKVTWDEDTKKYVCEPMLGITKQKRQLFGKLPCPTSYKLVQINLGCANWLAEFVPYHAINMDPLIKMLRKDQPKTWEPTEEMKKAWEKLMYWIENAPDLSIINYNHALYVWSDASLKGVGGLLTQRYKDIPSKPERVLGYYSKRFRTEHSLTNKHSSVFREALGLLYCLVHWHKFIVACQKTILSVDIVALVHMMSAKFTTDDPHLSRIIYKITTIGTHYMIRHRAAKYMNFPDALGRIIEVKRDPRIRQQSEVHKNVFGEWEMIGTCTPITHLAQCKSFFERYPLGLPEDWMDGKHEVAMEELYANLCEQIGRDDRLSAKNKNGKFKSLLTETHEQFKPLVEKLILKHTDADVDNAKFGTLPVAAEDPEEPIQRITCNKLSRCGKAWIQAVDKKNAENKSRRYPIDYRKYDMLNPASMSNFDLGPLVRLQDRNPNVRRIKMAKRAVAIEEQDESLMIYRLIGEQLLVTRKSKELAFTDLANCRIYLAPKEALYYLGWYHLYSAHHGRESTIAYFNTYFDSYQVKHMVKMISQACAACTLYNPIRAKQEIAGYMPRSLKPGERIYLDVMHLGPGYWSEDEPGKSKKQVYHYLLCIMDSFSGWTYISPLHNQETETVLNALRAYQLNYRAKTLHSDNATTFSSNRFLQGIKFMGFESHSFSTPNNSTANSRIERFIKSLRAVSWQMAKCNRQTSIWDVVIAANSALNMRPDASLAKYLPKGAAIPSRHDLFLSRVPEDREPSITRMLGGVPVGEREETRKMWEKLINDLNRNRSDQMEERRDNTLLTHQIQKDDYVFIKNAAKIHHEGRGLPTYDDVFFKVISVKDHKAEVEPLFELSNKRRFQSTHHLRKVVSSKVMKDMPEEMKSVYGVPFVMEELERAYQGIKGKPSQYMDYVAPPSRPNTKSGKGPSKRKKKMPIIGQLPAMRKRPEEESDSEDEWLAEKETAEDQDVVYNMDWTWPVTEDDWVTPSDPRLQEKGKKIGSSKRNLERYFLDNGDRNADIKADKIWREKVVRFSDKVKVHADKSKVAEATEADLKDPEAIPKANALDDDNPVEDEEAQLRRSKRRRRKPDRLIETKS